MGFDAKAFDRAQRRKVLLGVGGATKPKRVKPRKASKPRAIQPYRPKQYRPSRPIKGLSRREIDDAKIEAKHLQYAIVDAECEAVLDILQQIRSKSACLICGATISNYEIHKAWHDEIRQIEA